VGAEPGDPCPYPIRVIGLRTMAPKSTRPTFPHTSVACDVIRRELSARLDGETTALGHTALDSHLAMCEDCAEFLVQATDLSRRMVLRSSRPVPQGLVPTLSSILRSNPEAKAAASMRRWGHRAIGWRRALRWAAAVVPAGVAVVVLPLGAGANPRLVPSHVSTPCTVGLVHHGGASR